MGEKSNTLLFSRLIHVKLGKDASGETFDTRLFSRLRRVNPVKVANGVRSEISLPAR